MRDELEDLRAAGREKDQVIADLRAKLEDENQAVLVLTRKLKILLDKQDRQAASPPTEDRILSVVNEWANNRGLWERVDRGDTGARGLASERARQVEALHTRLAAMQAHINDFDNLRNRMGKIELAIQDTNARISLSSQRGDTGEKKLWESLRILESQNAALKDRADKQDSRIRANAREQRTLSGRIDRLKTRVNKIVEHLCPDLFRKPPAKKVTQ